MLWHVMSRNRMSCRNMLTNHHHHYQLYLPCILFVNYNRESLKTSLFSLFLYFCFFVDPSKTKDRTGDNVEDCIEDTIEEIIGKMQ
jgi:hypothetical protein